jgi:hypothetical protein
MRSWHGGESIDYRVTGNGIAIRNLRIRYRAA